MVTRYDLVCTTYQGDYLKQRDDGDYVSFDDYAELEAECAKLRDELAKLKAQQSGNFHIDFEREHGS